MGPPTPEGPAVGRPSIRFRRALLAAGSAGSSTALPAGSARRDLHAAQKGKAAKRVRLAYKRRGATKSPFRCY